MSVPDDQKDDVVLGDNPCGACQVGGVHGPDNCFWFEGNDCTCSCHEGYTRGIGSYP